MCLPRIKHLGTTSMTFYFQLAPLSTDSFVNLTGQDKGKPFLNRCIVWISIELSSPQMTWRSCLERFMF